MGADTVHAQRDVATCRRNLAIIGYAMTAYASATGSFPSRFEVLKPEYVTSECYAEAMAGPHDRPEPYVLHEHADSLPTNRASPLCWDAKPHAIPHPLLIWRSRRVWNVLDTSGHVEAREHWDRRREP